MTQEMQAEVHVSQIAYLMIQELENATQKFGPFNSVHEGYAVILEELDELWAAIKDKKSNDEALLKEAIQVGAMAMRFVYDLIDWEAK
jgi:hypothetical protein